MQLLGVELLLLLLCLGVLVGVKSDLRHWHGVERTSSSEQQLVCDRQQQPTTGSPTAGASHARRLALLPPLQLICWKKGQASRIHNHAQSHW